MRFTRLEVKERTEFGEGFGLSERFAVLDLILHKQPRPKQAERDDGEDDDKEQAAARHCRPRGAYGCAGGRCGAF